MSSNAVNAMINIGDLGKPADTLILKISEAVGGLYAPFQIRRIARAEAEAAIIRAEGEIELEQIKRGALGRLLEEEAQRQQNMEAITTKAIHLLEPTSQPENVSNDWIANFFEKSRIVSDTEMQEVWARILAGEANAPGTYSRRTVNFISDFDKADAVAFGKLCRFVWKIGGHIPVIIDHLDTIYSDNGLEYEVIAHLENIGIIQLASGMFEIEVPKRVVASYFQQNLTLSFPKEASNRFTVGTVILTRIGKELAPICSSEPVDGFFEYIKNKWRFYLAET